MSFRTGDRVLHRPSGETWTVAKCLDTVVVACGWPLSAGRISDCELIEAATDEESERLLYELSKIPDDSRGDYARRVLANRASIGDEVPE